MIVVSGLTSRRQEWKVLGHYKTLEEATEHATKYFNYYLHDQAYVQVKLERIVK